MLNDTSQSLPREHLWRTANVRLVPSGLLLILGITLASIHGNVQHGNFGHKIIATFGVLLFISAASTFLNVLTHTIFKLISHHHLSVGRAAAIQFLLRLFGYGAVLLTGLDLIGIPVGKLLLGGAFIGIILGVAAQQALGNFFASIVIIVTHPFSVGQTVAINSGALGGHYEGKIVDIGLTHTKLRGEDEQLVLLPNATLLSAATIAVRKKPIKPLAT